MNFSKAAWLVTSVLGVLLVSAWSGGCSSSSSGGSPNSVGNTAPGVCTDTCDKPCGSDNDCNTANGELCCDYSSIGNGAGKVCQAAKSCPTFCAQDTDCQTSMGQACEPVSLSNGSVKVCEQATQAIHECSSDAQCTGNNEICCTIYKGSGLCTAANACPKSCSTSSSCDTTQGEICCTSVAAVDPNLNVPGLCLNPQYSPCPKSCTTSSDCAATGDLCCNGVCQKTCPKSCNVDNDCTNQICCKSYNSALPAGPGMYSTGPTCTGTPIYTTCQQCQLSRGCTCPGCGSEAGTGGCTGTPDYPDCASCGNAFGCSSCLGCQTGTSVSCTGTASLCTNYIDQASCQAQMGCTWDSVGMTCSGTAFACATFTTTATCDAQSGCFAGTATCTGTLTPCTQLTSGTCSSQFGCTYSVGTSSCDGTPTPCTQLPVTSSPDAGFSQNLCTNQPGCIVTQ